MKVKKILKILGVIFVVFCLGFAGLFVAGTYLNARDAYQQKRVFADINNARDLLHQSAEAASIYSIKDLAISDYVKGTIIRSEKGLEAINLFENNLNTNLKKSVDLTEQAAKIDPQAWEKFTELINNRLDEKKQLYALDKEYLDNMRAYYNNQMTDEMWNKYANETYPAKMASWNTLNKANTDFNIENNLEQNPDYSAFNQQAINNRYKPTIKELLAGEKETNAEDSQVYYGINDQQYPIISEVYDDLGTIVKQSASNGYTGPEKYTVTTSSTNLKAGDYLFIAATGTNLKEDKKLYYLFSSNSPDFTAFYTQTRGANAFSEKPYFLYKVTPQDFQNANGKLKVEVKLKSDGISHRMQNGKYDDSSFIEYNLTN